MNQMESVKCPACGGNTVSGIPPVCHRCGRAGSTGRPKAKAGLGCLSIIGLLVFLIILTNVFKGSGGSTSTEPDSTGAWVAAQTFVKRHLKNPSDADFGSLMGDFQKTVDVVTYQGAGKYHVKAWVDATNGFGGKIRTYFVCDLEWEPADKSWKLDNLSFNQ